MKLAIVEDNALFTETLRGYMERYADAHNMKCEIDAFPTSDQFLFHYKPGYDCIFLDMDMPGTHGLDAAKELRKTDSNVLIVFSTSYTQFALDGYEVAAAGYLVKPYSYEQFSMTMARVQRKREAQQNRMIAVRNRDGETEIAADGLYYVEQSRHHLLYHTDVGVVDVWGTMPMAVEKLAEFSGFAKCGASYLINLRHVKAVETDTVLVESEQIPISHGKRKEFLQALNIFLSGDEAAPL